MTLSEQRIQLRDAGYDPIPVQGKIPHINGWQTKHNLGDEEIRLWESSHSNHESTGLITKLTPTLDVDIKNAAAVAAIQGLVKERFQDHGRILVRTGNAPKCAIPFRTSTPFKKITVAVTSPDGGTDEKIELMAKGQMIVAFGLHKDTHRPYTWQGGQPGEVPRGELPAIDRSAAAALVHDIVELLVNDFGYSRATVGSREPALEDTTSKSTEAELIEDIHEGRNLHDSIRDLSAKFMAKGFTETVTTSLIHDIMDNSKAPHDARYYERLDDIPRVVKGAIKYAPDKKLSAKDSWRERDKDGWPRPSMHNARIAVTKLGIDCTCDTFHNKFLFGYDGEEARHEITQMVGEVTDNGIIRLRQLVSDRFGFDPTDRHARDAVVSLALEHCFDPVADMLDRAEAEWDGVERLDRFAPDYLNCADTPLNRAFGRLTLIAAVRRVRQPGCKHDEIFTLESREGWNKSTVWRLLAGDENFSDAAIIGAGGREVQEQLAEVWIHENAELAGMRKADIDVVKTFASRISDDARPAYGHFLKKQKRHSIEVGTTNGGPGQGTTYLQSQSGNRRFWPAEVLAPIDIALVKQDRLQLWGEAAACESRGDSIVLDEGLWPAAADAQEERRVVDPWEDKLTDDASIRGIIHVVDNEERVASRDLLDLLVDPGRQEVRHAMRLSAVMHQIGWQRPPTGGKVTIGGVQVKGYFRFREWDGSLVWEVREGENSFTAYGLWVAGGPGRLTDQVG